MSRKSNDFMNYLEYQNSQSSSDGGGCLTFIFFGIPGMFIFIPLCMAVPELGFFVLFMVGLGIVMGIVSLVNDHKNAQAQKLQWEREMKKAEALQELAEKTRRQRIEKKRKQEEELEKTASLNIQINYIMRECHLSLDKIGNFRSFARYAEACRIIQSLPLVSEDEFLRKVKRMLNCPQHENNSRYNIKKLKEAANVSALKFLREYKKQNES